jgi:hypothetical protein
MTRVVQANRSQPADWAPTREQLTRMREAMNREAYPPAQRTGVGTVLRNPA